jgi:hypothetical protein
MGYFRVRRDTGSPASAPSESQTLFCQKTFSKIKALSLPESARTVLEHDPEQTCLASKGI